MVSGAHAIAHEHMPLGDEDCAARVTHDGLQSDDSGHCLGKLLRHGTPIAVQRRAAQNHSARLLPAAVA
ncbi:hypothetical protein DZE36_20145 [Xanthomonas campestris pv. campestris]|jgi:hypothetical protein|nr:hypothetical protein AEA01_02105 [Xanthomonas campestris pv. campestris]ALE67377.1 hypothetical protein AAW18_02080 [Xanthomonas campestris pv. campestris]QCX65965.1 hypothetical protein DFG55_05330 [Xanthomonas campestris pv. campestris]QCX69715.1 hypothetical protein DFG54_02040 [Xanthomonas campestris pv. campestris]RFF38561.1 hypothetical protein D0A42_20455 [Xanthomonas campestris pv. campestris]